MSKQDKAARSKVIPEVPMEKLEIGGAIYQTRLTAKFRDRVAWQRPDERKLLSVIPGTIQKLMVAEGDEVLAGTPLVILEAMKMRNEIRALVPGVIRKINVKEGEQVPKSHILLEFK